MKLLPSHRFLALLGAASTLFLLGPLPGFAVDAILIAALLLDAALIPGRDGLEIDRVAPDRLALGDVAEVRITARNRSGRPLRMRITDDVAPPLVRIGDEEAALDVGAFRDGMTTYEVRADGRGETALGDVHLRLAGPLGLAWVGRRIPRRDPVLVRPGVREVRRYRLLGLRQRSREAGLRNVRLRAEAGAFESLREYVPGDDPRRVDWKATARSSAPMVRQYEAERGQHVVIAIDAGRLMMERLGDRERIDYALTAALLLADVAAHSGDRVGLIAFSDRIHQFLPPSRISLSAMSDALARVEPRMVEPSYPAAFSYLARQLRRRSLLVLLTDVIDAGASAALIAHLSRAATRHLPLVLALRNPALEAAAASPVADEAGAYRRAAAEELLLARAEALRSMQRSGVLVVDSNPGDAAPAVVNRYLQVKAQGLL